MNIQRIMIIVAFLAGPIISIAQKGTCIDASEFGFSTDATGVENVAALQKAVDRRGTIVVGKPGIYKVAGTTYIGSNTTLEFGNGVVLQKVDEGGKFSHVLLNKGALTKTYDEHIVIRGLEVSVNGVDKVFDEVFGLRGQIAFFYVKDLKIEGFRCHDIMTAQFGIQVCTFEDLIIDDTILEGGKDGIHLGRGKRFTISNAVFTTLDDGIALNAHDYATSNPELGWIENGVVEKCWDLSGDQRLIGYFCRILAGSWIDWKKGMMVQNSDAVVSNGRIYRFRGEISDKLYKSITQPTFTEGSKVLDGINWVLVQQGNEHTAGVRNVTFRDIYLEKPRTGFSIHFDVGKWSRSYYPGAQIPMQHQLNFDNIRVLHNGGGTLFNVNTPIDVINITNSSFGKSGIEFLSNEAMKDYLPTKVNISGCIFNAPGEMTLLKNEVAGKVIYLQTSNNVEIYNGFKAKIENEEGTVTVNSDLTGLN